MRTIAISNYKGGVGKTTTAVNLASIYANQGQRILLIDLDPQTSATDFLGIYERAETGRRTSIELLYGNSSIADVAYETAIDGLSVIPSVIDLVNQNELLAEQTGRRVSGKTIKREEALAKTIEEDLADDWKEAADSGEISAAAVNALAKLGNDEQKRIASEVRLNGLSKRQRTEAIVDAIGARPEPDSHLAAAKRNLRSFAKAMTNPVDPCDLETLEEVAKLASDLLVSATSTSKTPSTGS